MKILPADFLWPGFQNNFLKEGQCIQVTAFSHSPIKQQNVSLQKGGEYFQYTLEYSFSIEEICKEQGKKNPTCISERKKYFLGYLENHVLISSI